MNLALIDIFIIVGVLLLSIFIGLYFRGKASSSLADFFIGGRNFPWYIAGLSMVATTFAADTPLYVTEIVRDKGISSNWQWWSMLISGMLTTFFFAKLWRRANVITELEFIELRYKGPIARFLIAFKSIYLGVIMNVIIISWVNFALIQIMIAFFGIPYNDALLYTFGAMAFAAIYSSLSGLWGVAMTDTVQFFIAMTGTVILSVVVLNNEKVGGMEGLIAQIPQEKLQFLPSLGDNAGEMFSLSILTFISYIGIQWWASWFPGAEPGGGGYIAQRIMSTKNEKHAVWSSLFFNIAHYCLRPWPWIIVALGTLILYPDHPEASQTFILTIKDLLPAGLKGLLLAAFLSAYLSTISTQLNWGASFLSNDFYKRFIYNGPSIEDITNEEESSKIKQKFVNVGRISTIIIMIIACCVTPLIEEIKPAWNFLLGCGAGLGMVLILRWFWWRINAWSELTATITPFIAYSLCLLYKSNFLSEEELKYFDDNNLALFITAGLTTIAWLIATFKTKPESSDHLREYFNRVRPLSKWTIKDEEGNTIELESDEGINLKFLIIAWLSSIVMTYCILFFIGKFIFMDYQNSLILLGIALVSFVILRWSMNKSNSFK